MPHASIASAASLGVEAVPVEVELDVTGGLPAVQIVGLPDAAVREARDRVKSALTNSRYRLPNRRITVDLASAATPRFSLIPPPPPPLRSCGNGILRRKRHPYKPLLFRECPPGLVSGWLQFVGREADRSGAGDRPKGAPHA
jgi:hypothetical protein